MASGAASQFTSQKLTLTNYPSWQTAFTDILASQADGPALLACLEEPLTADVTVAARTRDRKALGLIRNACSDPVRIRFTTAEHAFDCWGGIKTLIVAQCESNAHQLEVAYGQLTMRGSEDITKFVGRVEEMRRMLQFANVAKSDLSVKQIILKGLPAEFAPVSTSYLCGSDASSLEVVSILHLLGRLRVFEASLDRPKSSHSAKTAGKGNGGRVCTYCGKEGHLARQCFKTQT